MKLWEKIFLAPFFIIVGLLGLTGLCMMANEFLKHPILGAIAIYLTALIIYAIVKKGEG